MDAPNFNSWIDEFYDRVDEEAEQDGIDVAADRKNDHLEPYDLVMFMVSWGVIDKSDASDMMFQAGQAIQDYKESR